MMVIIGADDDDDDVNQSGGKMKGFLTHSTYGYVFSFRLSHPR